MRQVAEGLGGSEPQIPGLQGTRANHLAWARDQRSLAGGSPPHFLLRFRLLSDGKIEREKKPLNDDKGNVGLKCRTEMAFGSTAEHFWRKNKKNYCKTFQKRKEGATFFIQEELLASL